MSYSKATSVAIKGDYSKGRDVPAEERYTSITNQFYKVPVVRSNLGKLKVNLDGTMNLDSKRLVEKMKENTEVNGFYKDGMENKEYGSNDNFYKTNNGTERTELCQSFKDILHLEKKPVSEVNELIKIVTLYCWI